MASNSEMNLLLVKMLECKKFDKVDDVSRVKVVIEILLKLNKIFSITTRELKTLIGI